MGTWTKWERVLAGSFQGKPELNWDFTDGLGAYPSVMFSLRDSAGNMISHYPAVPGRSAATRNRGGAGVIAHLPVGELYGYVVRGFDNGIYYYDYGSQGDSSGGGAWRKMSGPGRLLSDAVLIGSFAGTREILGEGTEHQLAYCFMTNTDRQNKEATNWQDLDQPGESGGKKGINGRPAVVTANQDLHVFVRGQDNHLWHISGKYPNDPHKAPTFGKWINLGGGLTSAPVAINSGSMNNTMECFVTGANNSLWTIGGDGKKWSKFQNLGGQIKGLPTAVNTFTGDSTFVFGRGVHDKLWYRRRDGAKWKRWQSLDGQLTGDPELFLSPTNNGGANLTCMVLGKNGELWQRIYRLAKAEYTGAPDVTGDMVSYTVQSGDWLYRIGRSLDVGINEIKKANPQIRNFDNIQAGDKLSIPVTRREKVVFYNIQQGDTLSRIGRAFGVTVEALKSANNIYNVDSISAGATLRIPV